MGLTDVYKLYEDGHLADALSHLKNIEDHYTHEHPDYFDVKLLKAELYLKLGNFEKGEKLLNSILDIARRKGKKLERLDIIILLTDVLWRKGDWERSFFYIEMGEFDFTKLPNSIDPIEKAKRYAELKRLKGIYYRYNGELDLALEYFNESLVEAEQTPSDHLVADIYNLIGLVYQEQGDLTNAWNYYIKGYKIKKEKNDPIGQAVTLFNLGSIQEYIGELDAALENYMEGLDLANEVGNRRVKGMCLGNIGVIYHKKGLFEVAFEYLTKSLAIKSDLGNDNETSWTLYRITNLLLNSKKSELAPIFLDGLEELIQLNPQNKLISQHYNLIKASQLLNTDKTIDKAEAQQIFYDVINDTIIDHELTIYAMIKHCEILLSELKNTGDPEILDEIEVLFNRLHMIVTEQHSYPLMIEIYILQAKYYLLGLEYQRSLSLYNKAIDLAEEKGIVYLTEKISDNYQQLLEKVEEINSAEENEANIIARVEKSEMEEEVANLISQRSSKLEIFNEEPVLFIVQGKFNSQIYSKKFSDKDKIDDKMIQSFISALQSIIKEAFPSPGPVDRIKHGKYNLINREREGYNFIYVFKGGSIYTAIQKLDQVIKRILEREILGLNVNMISDSVETKISNVLEQIIT